ncbi:MAG: hypothetical protein DCF16_09450 [Alphaproteobacteria bacterium]|nr:MAG: hypothetical protein DCF16_09450 [Alphaproteobacteria bacterium]
MAAVFVHVSDIHFGQERGGVKFVHDDVKKQVLADAAREVAGTTEQKAAGILVTGDIAYSGQHAEYKEAGAWLDKLAEVICCKNTDVHVVPGNHDIDREQISQSVGFLLSRVLDEGEGALDEILDNDIDREIFYKRFKEYRPFAEGYNCSLDKDGNLKGKPPIELAPGRSLRFVGFNSALICSKRKDEEGKLLLGARQRVLQVEDGEELVVLAHHPLHWLQDSEQAKRYLRNRARVFISGHEHKPRVHVDPVKAGCDLMMIASGAMVPPTATEEYKYTYNIITFDWDADSDDLLVTVKPREWRDEDKAFRDAPEQLDGNGPTFKLACPNYYTAKPTCPVPTHQARGDETSDAPGPESAEEESVINDDYAPLLLRYFRDLLPAQRIIVLVKLKALPDDWSEPLSHAMERGIVDRLAATGRLNDLGRAMDDLANDNNGNGGAA